MKKILYVASTISHINNFHLDYIKALREEGNEVLVMSKGEGADFNIPFEKKFFSKENGKCRRMIREIIKRESFDSILLNTTLAAFHVRLACPKKNRPRVVNLVHGYLFSRHTGFLKTKVLSFCEKLVKRKTDAIITMNSDDLRLAKEMRFTSGTVYFSRGMGAFMRPSEKPREQIREELGVENSKMLLFVGELSARKNQRFLIEAMPKIKEKIPNAVLCLAGEGDKKEELEALCASLKIYDSVIFLGYRTDVPEIMSAADIYVSASVSEGMPFNIIEALGASLPVVASETKGQEDVIVDGESGFLYAHSDSEEFASVCVDVLEGRLCLKKEDVYNRYLYYSKEEVFKKTYAIMKEALDL